MSRIAESDDIAVVCHPFRSAHESALIFRREEVRRLERGLAKLADVQPEPEEVTYEIIENDHSLLHVSFTGDQVLLELGLPEDIMVFRYPYRTARVRQVLSLPRDDMALLEDFLAAKTGIERGGNHDTYKVCSKEGIPLLCVMCTNSIVHIGTKLIKGNW